MPFLTGRKLGMTYIIPPQLTPFSGPCFLLPSDLGAERRRAAERELTKELLEQVEGLHAAFFQQSLSPTVTDWLPFHWRGYRQTTRYTYRLNDISDSSRLFAAFDRDERQKKIERYDPLTTLDTDIDPADFARFHHRYWQRRGQRDLLSEEFIERVCRTALGRKQGLLAGLRDEEGALAAVRFVVYDDRCAYSLLSALDADHYRNGYTETLIWKVLQTLGGRTKAYDFEGSMEEGIEHFYRSFGGEQTPFSQITRCDSKLFALLMKLKRQAL